jgi:hypothetical protein
MIIRLNWQWSSKMRMTAKNTAVYAIILLIALYAGFGLSAGFYLKAHMPAMNVRGALWYAAVWPGFVAAGTFDTPSPPIPEWCFSFK